jgi:superfamily I DNA/RNA helicase
MGQQWLILGPPGTGKTTWIQRHARQAIAKRGPARVLFASFSRAAAAELRARDITPRADRVGTLHALGYRLLGCPPIAETLLAAWNTYCAEQGEPRWRFTRAPADPLDEGAADTVAGLEGASDTQGDELYTLCMALRHRCVPVARWPEPVQVFWQLWTRFKQQQGAIDFTDMIALPLAQRLCLPSEIEVGYFDEAQDMSKLEFQLAQFWGEPMEYYFIVGDPDQSIYEFRGAAPTNFIERLPPPEQRHLLAQSYRVPRAVHALATRWLRAGAASPVPYTYQPRDAEGFVRCLPPQAPPEATMLVADATERYLAQGQTVMFLAPCGYQLWPLLRALREQGVPYHNPYRRTRGDWNPLQATRGVSTVTRLGALLTGRERGGWTGRELQLWTPLLRQRGVWQPEGQAALAQLHPEEHYPWSRVATWLTPAVQAVLADPTGLGALEHYTRKAVTPQVQYLLRVWARGGRRAAALTAPPQVIVGTIHSVKGGEADVVYLDTALSPAGWRTWQDPAAAVRAQVVRQFYVALTRAREGVILYQGSPPSVFAPLLDVYQATREGAA